jgi:hypothetical protein
MMVIQRRMKPTVFHSSKALNRNRFVVGASNSSYTLAPTQEEDETPTGNCKLVRTGIMGNWITKDLVAEGKDKKPIVLPCPCRTQSLLCE